MTNIPPSIGDVLSHPNLFKWSDALYADPDILADTQSACLVLDPDSVESDDEEEPVKARERGFSYILSIQDIQSIYANLEAQGGAVSEEQLLIAFLHYFENDAFIVIDSRCPNF